MWSTKEVPMSLNEDGTVPHSWFFGGCTAGYLSQLAWVRSQLYTDVASDKYWAMHPRCFSLAISTPIFAEL